MKQIIFCSTLLWAIVSLHAQKTVSGIVLDKETGESVHYAKVYDLTNSKTTMTDFSGRFTIEAEPEVDSIKVTSLGYLETTYLVKSNMKIDLEISIISLDEVVISSNREQEKRTEAPIAISSIPSQTIEDNKPNTIDEVLNQTPGVNMVDLGNEQHTMSIRRPIDYGASYLYLEDGIPIRASGVFNHNALLEINMANTSKVEIIRGPASSIYGSEAIGGAVNFISKRPSVVPTAGVSIRASNIGYKRTDFYASGTHKDKLGIRFSGYYANQRDGIISHSDFDKLALSLSVNYLLTDHSELSWSNTLIDYYADMSGSIDSTSFYSKTYESSQTFTNRQVSAYRSKLALNHYWENDSKSTITGYFRTNSVKQNPSYRVQDDFKPWLSSGDPELAHGEINDNSFKSFGLIAQHKVDFDWLNSSLIAGGSFDFSPNTYEANYIRIHKNSDGLYESFEETDSSLANYTADLINIATYAQLKLQPFKGFNVIASLRYDLFNYDFDNNLGANDFTSVLDGQDQFNRLTPKLGITYDLGKTRGLYANYSQGFVPPQVTELYRGNDVPVLKPVYYTNLEIGSWVSFAKEKAKLEVSLYKMDGLNEIISVLQDDGSSVRKNAGKTTHQGIEYGLSIYPHKDITVKFSGTNAMHKFVEFNENGTDFSDKEMPQAPSFIANAQVIYKPSYVKGLRVSLEWRHIDEYFMDQENIKVYEGYNVFNLRAGYEWKSFEVWLNMINATNELYATVARSNSWGQTYSLGKPRNFNLGLAYKFKKK